MAAVLLVAILVCRVTNPSIAMRVSRHGASAVAKGPGYNTGAPVPSQVIQPHKVQFQNYDSEPLHTAAKVIEGQRQNCYRLPKYLHFNISDDSYYYPQNNIFQELREKKDVLQKIFENGAVPVAPHADTYTLYAPQPSDLQSRVGNGLTKGGNSGCVGYRLLLRSFDSHGGRCWVVYPRHQAVSFLDCRSASRCAGGQLQQHGQYSTCAIEERAEGVWAWCETLPFGQRITKIYLPLPVRCRCPEYDC